MNVVVSVCGVGVVSAVVLSLGVLWVFCGSCGCNGCCAASYPGASLSLT